MKNFKINFSGRNNSPISTKINVSGRNNILLLLDTGDIQEYLLGAMAWEEYLSFKEEVLGQWEQGRYQMLPCHYEAADMAINSLIYEETRRRKAGVGIQ